MSSSKRVRSCLAVCRARRHHRRRPPARRAPHLPRSGARQPSEPHHGADRTRLVDPQDQGRRRRPGRGEGRAPDRLEDPRRAPAPRLPGGDDADRAKVHVRGGWQRRPREVLQPPPRRPHAPHPRRRVERPRGSTGSRRSIPPGTVGWTDDIYRPSLPCRPNRPEEGRAVDRGGESRSRRGAAISPASTGRTSRSSSWRPAS